MSVVTLAQVTRRVVNLNDRISQNDTVRPPVDGGRGVFRQCVLNRTGTTVIVKRRFVPGDGVAVLQVLSACLYCRPSAN